MRHCRLIYGVLAFCAFFYQFGIAQERNDNLLRVEKEIFTANDTVNKFVNDLFTDFFLKNDYRRPEEQEFNTNSLPSTEDITLKKQNNLSDRALSLEFSVKAPGATLRILDKIYGFSEELNVFDKFKISYQSVDILLRGCFYRKGNLSNDALAFVSIYDNRQDSFPFTGWISSTQSHLTNYDNYRYSVWLLSCIISDQE